MSTHNNRVGEGERNLLWQSVAWTWNETEELWDGIEEVEDLRYEEKQHGLAEVAEDTNHSKCHSCEVAERVTHKHTRWVPEEGRGEEDRGWGSELDH